jgi:signal transduction histidine kinase
VRDVAFADNGLVHGPTGGVVTVSVTNGDGSAVLTVRNESPVPGTRPDPTREHAASGGRHRRAAPRGPVGLGLSIVERDRGTISVDGAEFTVRLRPRTGLVAGFSLFS